MSQVLDGGTQVVARGSARCASHVPDRGAQAGAQTVSCGHATPSQQENNTRKMRQQLRCYARILFRDAPCTLLSVLVTGEDIPRAAALFSARRTPGVGEGATGKQG